MRADDGVTAAIEPGEMVTVIGPSCAGKSTLLRLVNRLADRTGGEIRYGGEDIGALRGRRLLDWRSRCAMGFQHFHLCGRRDVVTNVLLGRLRHTFWPCSLIGRFSRQDRIDAARALERVGPLPQALQRADCLSGGQLQRVAIARALLQRPAIPLADEPISALDPRSARSVLELLSEVNRSERITVINNLHDLNAAREFSSRILGMRAGKLVFDGAPSLPGDSLRSRVLPSGAPA